MHSLGAFKEYTLNECIISRQKNSHITGEFPEDYYVTWATATMPQEMIEKLVGPIIETAENASNLVPFPDEIIERDLVAIGIMASFGKYHADAPKIRKPLCLPYFAIYHITFEKPFLPNDYMPDEEELKEVLQGLLKS